MEHILHIDSLAYGTAGVGRLESGKAAFVEGAAPGDTVRAEVIEERPSFARARLIEVIEASPARRTPPCPLAGACGGCPWMHLYEQAQLEAKRANAVDALARIGGVPREEAERLIGPARSTGGPLGVRNKLELAARMRNGRFELGFHGLTDKDALVEPRSCPIADKALAKAPAALRGALRFLQGGDDLGIYRVGVRASARRRSLEIALWTEPSGFPRAAVAKTLASALPHTSLVRVIAPAGKARAVKRVEVLAGKGYWEERVAGHAYQVSAPSFFQVNTAGAEILVEEALAMLRPTAHESIADLYCGVGTFTLPIAERCDNVFAVESAASSVRDLRRNLERAGLDAEPIGGDSVRELTGLGRLDALLVDPPRAGLAPEAVDAIAGAAPSRLVYVSCDPATWARDVSRLASRGFSLVKATPVDLFPQSYHCELVSLLESNRTKE